MIGAAIRRRDLARCPRREAVRDLNGTRSAANTEGITALALVAVGVPNQIEHGVIARARSHASIPTRQLSLGGKRVIFVQIPHLLRVRKARRTRHEAGEKVVQVVHVPNQETPRVGVAGRIDRLGKVDHHGFVTGEQHVVIGKVSVHDADRQHAHNLPHYAAVDHLCDLGSE